MSETDDIRLAAREFAYADNTRAWAELFITSVLYIVFMGLALAFISIWWVVIPATLATSALGLRIYMIQHDCLHNSFFTERRTNEIIGVLTSFIAMTPFKATRYIHNLHHTHVGDLDRRDAFEIDVMTLREWNAATPSARLYYRIYRSPLILVFVGPFVFFGILRRLPLYGFRIGFGDLILHNFMIAGYLALIYAVAGWPGLLVWFASVYVATSFGALIPYVVHNFEHMHWGTKPELDFQTAALKGSSVLKWGRLFDLAMLNIGYHDLHHLNAMIPGYNLKKAYETLDARGLLNSEKIGFFEGLGCLKWKLYDEEQGRMIGFPAREDTAKTIAAE